VDRAPYNAWYCGTCEHLQVSVALWCCRLQTAFAPNMHTVAALQRKAKTTTTDTSINQLASSFVAALQVCCTAVCSISCRKPGGPV